VGAGGYAAAHKSSGLAVNRHRIQHISTLKAFGKKTKNKIQAAQTSPAKLLIPNLHTG